MQKPSFDTWTTIFLFAAVQGIFVSVVLCFIRKENRQARILLAMISLLFSITLIEYVFWWTGYLKGLPHLQNISAAFPFLFGPLIFYYFKSVFEKYRFKFSDLISLIPFLINIYDLLPFYAADTATKLLWLSGAPYNLPIFPYWPWVRIGHMIFYSVLIFYYFNALSLSQPVVRRWFHFFNLFYIGFILSYASYFILIHFPGFKLEWDYMISFSMMFFIYFLAWFGYLQPAVFQGFTLRESMHTNIITPKYKHSSLTNDVSNELAKRLNNFMKEHKFYRNSDLSLELLAEKIGTSKHNLSQIINEKMGMNFFEYINNLRIGEAQELLMQQTRQQMNIIEVAYQVGFNNKVSFNNMFKKITGMTPTEFRNEKSASLPDRINLN